MSSATHLRCSIFTASGPRAGLQVWGTLRILLEAKAHGLSDTIEPSVKKLSEAGMWISAEVKERILVLAGERVH